MSRGSDRYLSLKFQEGDAVLVVADLSMHGVPIGTVQRVVRTDRRAGGGLFWKVSGSARLDCGWVTAEEIVPMEKVREMFCKEAAS